MTKQRRILVSKFLKIRSCVSHEAKNLSTVGQNKTKKKIFEDLDIFHCWQIRLDEED